MFVIQQTIGAFKNQKNSKRVFNLGNRPSILKAKEIGERIIHKMKEYVEVFVMGMVG